MLRRLKRFLIIILILAAAAGWWLYGRFAPERHPAWGLNFSVPQAEYLGYDSRQMYLDILDDLRPKKLRLMAYWEMVEPREGQYQFAEVDFMLKEAEKRGVLAIVVVGKKQPRWPECHQPVWAENKNEKIKNKNLLNYIQKVVERYKDNQAVAAWQVENEPFFPYGPECAAVDKDLYQQEIELVNELDDRPIVVTDSGEKGDWLRTARAGGDIFGSTMYREVYYDRWRRYVKYPIPPALYRLKAGMVKTLTGVDRIIGVELQAEPWFVADVFATPWERQQELMNPEIFAANVEYARRVGFAENYLWGVEWWYYAKEEKGDDSIWQAAKKLLGE